MLIFRILQIAVPFVWFGAVGAISFMEAPLKFTAPNITLALGLGIGRIVFQTLNKIEIVLALVLIASVWFARPKGKLWIYLIILPLAALLAETFWLLPILDERAAQVLAGAAPTPASSAHIIYIILDAIKFIALFALGTILAKQHIAAAPPA